MNGVETAQRRLGKRRCRRADRAVDLKPEKPADCDWNTDQRLRGRPSQDPGHLHLDEGGGDERCIVTGIEPGDKVGAVCLLANELDDGGGVQINHQRSSSRMSASAAATSTPSSPSFGGSGTRPPLVGGTARPAATSWGSVARSSPPETSGAMGSPGSVISTVSPPLTRASTWLVFWFSSRTPTRSMKAV